jgi:hypothetical protein
LLDYHNWHIKNEPIEVKGVQDPFRLPGQNFIKSKNPHKSETAKDHKKRQMRSPSNWQNNSHTKIVNCKEIEISLNWI